ncbi:unnamed protein product [Clonostachys byssicola]|uniref:Uncharacterized protein n=1 Tax=Clonostachys byssicola TaxID=160290 RepID=A0A9N9UVU1_9HYPO|nr:unnamed protein product [Clonostachys byssicola]
MARRVPQLFIVQDDDFDGLTDDDGENSSLISAGGYLADRARIQFHRTQDPECHMCPEIEACQGRFGELNPTFSSALTSSSITKTSGRLFMFVFEVEW